MWTLAPSLVVTTEPGWGELRSLATHERWELRPEDLSIVEALAAGIPDGEEPRELAAAQKRGWAGQAASTLDAHVRDRIIAMEKGFAWCRSAIASNTLSASHAAVLEAHAGRRRLRGFAKRSALPETVVRRAYLLGKVPLRALVLGDDDFISVALRACGHDVTVFAGDLREPLPTDMIAAFDAFIADPLSGPEALRLCLARGLAALKPLGRGLVCVSDAAAQSFETLAKEFSVDTGDRYSDFNHYYGHDYTLAFHTSDVVLVKPGDPAALKPHAGEPYLVRGMMIEDHFLETPASRYAFNGIRADCELIHLDTALQLLARTGRLQIRNRSLYEDGGVRSYLVHTKEGSAVFVRLVPEARIGELFVAPADTELENGLLAVLMSVLGVEGTVVQKRRVRGQSVFTMT